MTKANEFKKAERYIQLSFKRESTILNLWSLNLEKTPSSISQLIQSFLLT